MNYPRTEIPTAYSQCLPDGKPIDLQIDRSFLTVHLDYAPVLRFKLSDWFANRCFLRLIELRAPEGLSENFTLKIAFCCLCEMIPTLREVELDAEPALLESLSNDGLNFDALASQRALCSRSSISQVADFWLSHPLKPLFPIDYTETNGRRHPIRPRLRGGQLYNRHIRSLKSDCSFRTLDPIRDLDLFHEWMNETRVSRFWELEGDLHHHETYIAEVLSDPHIHPLIGRFNAEPFGYFEAYWAKEDRIGAYYEAEDYDRGLHVLVGESRFRGPHRVAAWLTSLVHFLFLEEPRTRNIVAEPRSDNHKMIQYFMRAGFHKIKDFDFPHKRAALMVLPREEFFQRF